MKNFCKYIAICILILGMMGSIYGAYISGTDTASMITYFLVGIISTIISFVIFLALYEILDALEDIQTRLIKITTQKNESANSDTPDNKTSDSMNGWECPQCGRINPNYTTTCACGNSK
ncbi:MAG: hypothetical protein LUH14_11205 [Clostridiaceae bacterium]|nr:hypothetical protein [Clostridiaceae bacterium]